jgi:hypothetical protein
MKKAKRRGRPHKVKPPKPIRVREHMLRPMIREACRTGMVEAIEHCSNFWSVGDGYKKYIDHQIKSQAEELMAAVKAALREAASPRKRTKR